MPYSFTQIEKDKSTVIGFVFFFLILLYFATIWGISLIISNYYMFSESSAVATLGRRSFNWLGWLTTAKIFGASMLVAGLHWLTTSHDMINKMLRVLKAERLSSEDTYHKQFANIVDEVSVATGGVKIEPVVIPTMAMNAFALSDFSGRNIIGVTEGMLARLTRSQIEAVVGHEAAHIVTGDCKVATVTCSLFELYSGMLKGLELLIRGSGRRTMYSRRSSRSNGSGLAFILLIYVFIFITNLCSQMLRLFISRQREFRADAIATRLTRDPLSLAEALVGIAYHWRGSGLASEKMEAIFIMNPENHLLDESEGLWANLFSTHPPIDSRLKVLLDMAHADLENVYEDVKKKSNRPKEAVPMAKKKGASHQWMANNDGNWEGPFDLSQIIGLGWIRPDTWIRREGQKDITMASDDLEIASALSNNEGESSTMKCIKCHIPLRRVDYEGVQVHKCPFCQGSFVHNDDVKRIVIRQDVGFSDEIKMLGEKLIKDQWQSGSVDIDRNPKTLYICPKCNHAKHRMNRLFYTPAYHIIIDRCYMCQMVWFDQHELEILQYLVEHNTKKSKE